MEQQIRKLIREVLGSYIPVKDISDRYAKKVIDITLKQSDNGTKELNQLDENLVLSEWVEAADRENTGIDFIVINIFPKKDNFNSNRVSGKFDVGSSKSFKKGNDVFYSAHINLFLINWDTKYNLLPGIKNVLSHEIFHAFRHIKQTKNPAYYDVFNKSRNEMNFYNVEEKNETIKQFMEIFYLSTPEEITARIHEASTQMENLKLKFKNKNADEIIQELGKLSVFKDFLKIQNFNLENILNLPDEVKIKFVDNFNKILKKNKIKHIMLSPDDFFKFWIGRAKKMGLEARHKIVSQALNLFSDKEISEYGNKKFSNGYGEQFVKEIMENLNTNSLEIIYEYSENEYYSDYNKILLNEIKHHSTI